MRALQRSALAGLSLSYASPAEVAALSAAQRACVLGCVLYSSAAHAGARLPFTEALHVPLPLLGAQRAVCELWSGNPCAAGEHGGIAFRHDGDTLFGRMVVPETPDLEQSMLAAYDAMFTLLDAQRYGTLLRVWNFVPAINEHRAGEERYRQFNRARHTAFVRAQRSVVENVPAACALGLPAGERPVLYFIASRGAALPFENPRQMRASEYPRDYGERSPVFSGACLSHSALGSMLFVSGTASIRGHATQHQGDLEGQTRESLANLAALLAAIDASDAAPGIAARDLAYKVYVRHPGDHECVRDIVRATLGTAPLVLYAHADICRDDLLVEIEAAGPVTC